MRKIYFLLFFVTLLCISIKADNKYNITNTNNEKEINNIKSKRSWEDVKFDVNIDANKLVETIIKEVKGDLISIIYQDVIHESTPKIGGRFISTLANDYLIAAYYHPKKCHYVSASGKTSGTSYAVGGEWAKVRVGRSRWGGNTSHPDVTCESDCDELRVNSIDNDEVNNNSCELEESDYYVRLGNNTNSDQNLSTNGIENLKYYNFLSIFIMLTSIMILQLHYIF